MHRSGGQRLLQRQLFSIQPFRTRHHQHHRRHRRHHHRHHQHCHHQHLHHHLHHHCHHQHNFQSNRLGHVIISIIFGIIFIVMHNHVILIIIMFHSNFACTSSTAHHSVFTIPWIKSRLRKNKRYQLRKQWKKVSVNVDRNIWGSKTMEKKQWKRGVCQWW